MKKILLSILFLSILLFPSYVHADGPYLNIPPTNAFDKIRSDSGSISALNFSMPLIIKGGSGISTQSNNATHTLTISSTTSNSVGTYNQTQANNVVKNSKGYQINFINGTGATVNVQNSHSGNQVNVTVSATGVSSGVTSLNALTGALTIACVTGNTTCTTSGGNTITVNTAYNVVVTGGSAQTITKGITMSNANFTIGNNAIIDSTENLKPQIFGGGATGWWFLSSPGNNGFIGIGPSSNTNRANLVISRTYDLNSNFEQMYLGSQVDGISNNFGLNIGHGGSGLSRAFEIMLAGVKEMTFNTNNTITANVPLYVNSGTNIVYRCTGAGALPVGTLTTVSANCLTSIDTGLRVP